MRIIPRPRTHRAPLLPRTPLNTFNTPSKCTLDPPVAAGHRASIDVGGELLFWVLGTTHRKCYCKLRVTCGLLPLRESSQRLQIAHHIPSHEALGFKRRSRDKRARIRKARQSPPSCQDGKSFLRLTSKGFSETSALLHRIQQGEERSTTTWKTQLPP